MKSKIPIIIVCASVLILLSLACYYMFSTNKHNNEEAEAQAQQIKLENEQKRQKALDIAKQYGVAPVDAIESLDTGTMTDQELAEAYLSKVEIASMVEGEKVVLTLTIPYIQTKLYLNDVKVEDSKGEIDSTTNSDFTQVEFKGEINKSYKMQLGSKDTGYYYTIPFTVR